MLTTRYGGKPACGNCPEPAIAMRISKDGGAHWRGGRYLCPCRGSKAQYDPEIEMDAHGSLHAAWLDGFDPGVTYSRSDDGGRTWTRPVAVDKQLSFSDKPIVAVSGDGQDVYIAFNGPPHGAAWVAVSHNGGDHFGQPVLAEQNGRYHFAGGGTVSPDGTVAFGQTSYNQESTGTSASWRRRPSTEGSTGATSKWTGLPSSRTACPRAARRTSTDRRPRWRMTPTTTC
jgi:hypothetical protein